MVEDRIQIRSILKDDEKPKVYNNLNIKFTNPYKYNIIRFIEMLIIKIKKYKINDIFIIKFFIKTIFQLYYKSLN